MCMCCLQNYSSLFPSGFEFFFPLLLFLALVNIRKGEKELLSNDSFIWFCAFPSTERYVLMTLFCLQILSHPDSPVLSLCVYVFWTKRQFRNRSTSRGHVLHLVEPSASEIYTPVRSSCGGVSIIRDALCVLSVYQDISLASSHEINDSFFLFSSLPLLSADGISTQKPPSFMLAYRDLTTGVLNSDEVFPDDYDSLQPPKYNGKNRVFANKKLVVRWIHLWKLPKREQRLRTTNN